MLLINLFSMKGKELPTFKDMDFRNNMQKVYVTEEEKEKFMEKLKRDVEVTNNWPVVAPFYHTVATPVHLRWQAKCFCPACFLQFLVKLKIMDYSLLLGIHDVGRAEREEEEGEEVSNEEEQETENGLAPAIAVGSYGTSPEGIAGYMSSCKPLGPGEFDPYVDVYAIQSCAGK